MSRRTEQIRAARQAAQAVVVEQDTPEPDVRQQGRVGNQTVASRQKQDDALSLRAKGLTYRQIAAEIGYTNPAAAFRAVEIALDRQPYEDAARVRQVEAEKLDALEQMVHSAIDADMPLVSDGRVVMLELDGEKIPVIDYAHKFKGVDRLLAIATRRAKLQGLDAPTRHVIEVLDESTVDAAIAQELAELERLANGAPVPVEP